MPTWENLTQRLQEQVRSWTEERRAELQRAAYEEWAKGIGDRWLDDLERALGQRVGSFPRELRDCLTVERLSRGAHGEALRLALGQNELLVSCGWQRGQAPHVHLTFSKRRQGRYCQLVPLAVGWLVPRELLEGYQLRPMDGSSHELTCDALLLRAFELLNMRPLT